MKSILRFAGSAFFGILILGLSNSQAGTLQDEVQHMLQTHPEIRAVSFNRLARDEEVKQAWAGYLPTLDISASYGVFDQNHPFNDTSSPRQTVLSLRQNVFRGFATQFEVERQKARVNSEAFLLQGTADRIALNTSRVYLNVLRQLEILDLAKENVLIHQRIFDQIKLRSESGVDRKADFDQVTGRLSLAESDVVVTQANVSDAATEYRFVVGHMPENPIRPLPVDRYIPASFDEAEQLAVTNHPILKSAEADVDARQAQYTVAKSAFYPKIDLAADQKWADQVDYDAYQEEFSAAAVIRFNLFNGLQDKARVAETKKLICEAEEIRNNTERQIKESVGLSWVSYQSTVKRIKFLEDYVKSTSVTAEAFNKQWNIGRRTMFDVLDIEAELINAKIALVNARYDNLYAEYRILADLGSLIPALGLQMPLESRVDEAHQMKSEDNDKASPES